jgi:hypothetical protein
MLSSLVAGVVARPVAPAAAIRPQDGDACAAGDQDYYMTQPGGAAHEGGHMFVYTTAVVPEIGTEIELSGFPDQVFTVEEFSDSSRGQLEAANAQSFSVSINGGTDAAHFRDSDSDACYTDTEYYALSSGGAGSEEGGGHIYVHTLGPHPPVGTKVTLEGTASTLTGKHYNPEMTKIKTIEWEVVEGDWDTAKGTKEYGNPRTFALKTADGSAIGSILPYDKQNSYACYGTNEIYKMVGGGECGAGGYVYLYTRSVRPPIGTNVYLTAYPDVEFEVVEDLEETTACGSTRSAKERENPGEFLLRTVDGGATHLPLPLGTRSDALSPPETADEGEAGEEGEAGQQAQQGQQGQQGQQAQQGQQGQESEEGEEGEDDWKKQIAKKKKQEEKAAAKKAAGRGLRDGPDKDDDAPAYTNFRFALGEDDSEAPTIGRWGCKGAPGYDQLPLGKFSCESTSDPDTAIGTFACSTGEEGEEEGEVADEGEVAEEGQQGQEGQQAQEGQQGQEGEQGQEGQQAQEGQQGQEGEQGQEGQQGEEEDNSKKEAAKAKKAAEKKAAGRGLRDGPEQQGQGQGQGRRQHMRQHRRQQH